MSWEFYNDNKPGELDVNKMGWKKTRLKHKLTKAELSEIHRMLRGEKMLPCDKIEMQFHGNKNAFILVCIKGKKKLMAHYITERMLDIGGINRQLDEYFMEGDE